MRTLTVSALAIRRENAARRLGDGYRVEVRVVIWRDEATLEAPIGSLFRRGDAWAAFLVEDRRAR